MNILYEYVLFCKVAIHHEHAAIFLPSLAPLCLSLSFTPCLSGRLGAFTAQLDEFNYTVKAGWRGWGVNGWTDGQMDEKNIF